MVHNCLSSSTDSLDTVRNKVTYELKVTMVPNCLSSSSNSLDTNSNKVAERLFMNLKLTIVPNCFPSSSDSLDTVWNKVTYKSKTLKLTLVPNCFPHPPTAWKQLGTRLGTRLHILFTNLKLTMVPNCFPHPLTLLGTGSYRHNLLAVPVPLGTRNNCRCNPQITYTLR